MSDWESRMAERALARRVVGEAEDIAAAGARSQAAVAVLAGVDEACWHGWHRIGDHGLAILVGTVVHCAGCGRWHGVTTVAFDKDWEPPGPTPDWPFPPDACPVCEALRS